MRENKIYWFTGQPGAGKTVLSLMLKTVLETEHNSKIFHIDGDELRTLFNNQKYGREGREENIKRAQDIAKFLNSKGIDVIISLVSPYRDLRNELKDSSKVIEVYIHTDDVRGREGFHVENYEKPTENYIDIDTTDVSEFTSLGELITKINEYGNK